MSTMPLGMKLPVLDACDDLLHATELCEKSSVKYDGKEKNLQKNLSLHNTEVPASAVQFDSTCHLLLSHLMSEPRQGKNDGGPDGNTTDDEQRIMFHQKYYTPAVRRKMQPPTVTTLLSSKNRSLLTSPYQKSAPFVQRKKSDGNTNSLETFATCKTCKVSKGKASIGKQMKYRSAPNLTRNDTASLYSLLGVPIPSDLTPRILRTSTKIHSCSTELPCNLTVETSHEMHPKLLDRFSDYESKYPLFQSRPSPDQLYGCGIIAGDHSIMYSKLVNMNKPNNIMLNHIKSKLTLIAEEIVENTLKEIFTDHSYSLSSVTDSSEITEKKLQKEEAEHIQCAPPLENIDIDKVVDSVYSNTLQERGYQLACYTNTQNIFPKVVKDVAKTSQQWKPSVHHPTLLPATTCLEDLTNNPVASISDPSFSTKTHSEDHSNVLAVTFIETATQIRHEVKHTISNYAVWNTNNSNGKQYLQAHVDIQQVVDSVYHTILQSYETPEALEAALASNSGTLLDKIANTVILETTHHLQPLLTAEESPQSIVEDILHDSTVYHNHPSCGPSKMLSPSAVFSASFLEDVISGILIKIVFASNVMDAKDETISNLDLREAAIKLVYPLVREINASHIKVVHIKEDTSDYPKRDHNDIDRVIDSVCQHIFGHFGSYQAVQKDIHSNSSEFSERISSLVIMGITDYQIEPSHAIELSPHLYTTLEAINIVRKVQNIVKKSRHQDRPLSPITTVLSYNVLQEMIIKIIDKMLPSSGNIIQLTENQSNLSDSKVNDLKSKCVQEVMLRISAHEIWYTQDATFIQRVHSQKDLSNVVDTVYNKMLHAYGNPLAVPDNITTGSEHVVKRLSRLLFREISNPNFMTFYSESSSCSSSTSVSWNADVSWERSLAPDRTCVYSSSFLEEIISGIISQIFFTVSDQIRQGKDAKRLEIQLNNMAVTFVNSVLMEIENAQVRVTNISEEKYKCSEIYKHAVDSIVNFVFSTIFDEYENDSAVYTSLTSSRSMFAEKLVRSVLSAISDYQFPSPVTEDVSVCSYTALDANNIVPKVVNSVMEASNQGKSSVSLAHKVPSITSVKAASFVETLFDEITQPFDESHLLQPLVTVLSSTVLEEIVAKFLSKLFFNCPKLTLGTKDVSSVCQVKRITEKLLNALYITISEKQIQINQDLYEARYVHPKDNQVVDRVVDAVYTNVYQLSKSHLSIFQNLTGEGDILARLVASLMIAELCNYHFQPCYSQGKLSDKSIGIESSYIVQRVLNDIRGMPPHSPLLESSSHGLYAPFLEEIVGQFLTKMFISSKYATTARIKSTSLEAELNKIASRLINTVLKELSKGEINVIKPAKEEHYLHPEDEDFIAVVVDSVYISALHESGSPLKLFKALTSGCTVVSERIASFVMKEISKYQLQSFLAAGVACDSYTDMEVAHIVEKVLTDVAAQSSLEFNAEHVVHSVTDKIIDITYDEESEDELPIIIPHIKHVPLEIDLAIVAVHLAVISVKTKPLDMLENLCLLQTGQTLAHVRKSNMFGKSTPEKNRAVQPLFPEFVVENENQRRASLDTVGRLHVKPKKLVSRNSFLNMLKPDITHVELLKEVKTKEELIIRLLAHDIEHHDEYEDFDEVVLKEESCLIGSELEKSSKAKLSKKHCCSCIGSDSTKTKDSQRKPVSTQTDKDQGGNVSHFNKNTSASNTDSLMENRKHRFDGRQLNNSAIISNSLNSNENSAKCTVSNRLDFKTGSLARDSFLARRGLQNCLSESSNSHLSLYGRPHIHSSSLPNTA